MHVKHSSSRASIVRKGWKLVRQVVRVEKTKMAIRAPRVEQEKMIGKTVSSKKTGIQPPALAFSAGQRCAPMNLIET